MGKNVVGSRQMQRNYRKLIDEVKRTRQPLYLGARFTAEAVLLDVATFEYLRQKQKQRVGAGDIRRTLDELRKSGKQGVNLAQFVHEDRKCH